MIAPMTKVKKITMRCCFAKNFEETIPTLANKIMARGISNMKPNGNRNAMTKSKYCFSENIGCNSSVLKPIKNFIPAGITKKKENAKPDKNKIKETGTITEIRYLSMPMRAGKINRHI